MPHVVTGTCCADASCVLACPVNCIHPAPGEPGFGTTDMLFIDPATCVGCSACVTACPVGAIVPDTKLTIETAPYAALNAEYFERSPHADRTPLALVPPQRRLRRGGPFRVAVIGAGPAGLYTADELLKHPEVASVDVYDKLHTPHGLVRHGVAPDHATTKKVTDLFEAIENEPGFRYVLGAEVGTTVSVAQLQSVYHAVVFAVGASSDRTLGIPGESLTGSVAATDVVGWYNGHPDHRDAAVTLDHERAVVVGNGNVALDVARMLTRDTEWLSERTDIAPHALDQLRNSRIREVQILGRRGPADAAFTVPELMGLAALTDVDVVVEADPAQLQGDDQRSRLLAELAARPRSTDATRRRIVLTFAVSPVEILGQDGRVTGVRVARNDLVEGADGAVVAVPTSDEYVLDAGLVVRSVGFRGVGLPGLPFDERTGTVPNNRGRVAPGVFVVGWIKRGPRGFIGTNKTCAQETVEAVLDHLDSDITEPHHTPDELIAATIPRAGDLAAWRRLDAEELALGRRNGRPRVKIVDRLDQEAVAARVEVRAPRRLLRT
ncbi:MULTISPECIES: FAD-dependent oxidoreductase [Nocardiaceae]|uniref:ferredoxin--NADP(+) reductase n=1 Tax=Rhodococcoides corynebacterioides TaxID=53972 RepID=A0ABS2KZ57_9NOCA|nr:MULTISPECIES: FAD-dependent oxidoreductase [Rhodococcus]MBM7417222.1 ferredoxin--NADP+ reductase [Rhodococcus corynebacterioides]MBP1115475.1 ferredoxin--NADP+ reductase [Rhodococcus sp. PvP016]